MRLDIIPETAPYIDYEIFGDGAPLFFLPGGGSNILYYKPFLLELSTKWKVIGLNYPEFNTSLRLSSPITLNLYVSTLAAAIKSFGFEKNYVIGHSMGGGVAVTLAQEHPEIVSKLVLIAPMLEQYSQSQLHLATKVAINATKSDRKKDLFKEKELWPTLSVSARNIPAMLRQLEMLTTRFPVPPEFAPATEKLLLIAENDYIFPFEQQNKYMKSMQQLTSIIFSDGGHEPMFRHSQQFVAAITEFFTNKV